MFLRHNDPVPLPILRLNETLCLSFRRDTYPTCKRLLRDTTQIRDPLKSTIKLPVLSEVTTFFPFSNISFLF